MNDIYFKGTRNENCVSFLGGGIGGGGVDGGKWLLTSKCL